MMHSNSRPARKALACTILALGCALALAGCHKKAPEKTSEPSLDSNAASAPASPQSSASSALGATPAAAAPATREAGDVNVASLPQGAFALNQKSDDDAWFRLLNDVPDSTGIQDSRNPYTISIALPDNATIHAFRFVASNQVKVTPNHLKVETSGASADGPWTVAYDQDVPGAADIAPGKVIEAEMAAPVTARWLRLTLSSPPGAAPYGIGLTQFAALGKFDNAEASVRNVAGLYHFPLNFGSDGYVLLKQQGAGIDGCYFEAVRGGGNGVRIGKLLGTISGGIEHGGVLRFTRTEADSNTVTPGIMTFEPNGKHVYTALMLGDTRDFDHVKEVGGNRIGDSALECKVGNASPAEAQLEKTGKLALYGVNFDLDKATLRADAKPVLDNVAGILKAHPDWKIEIGGHTDSTGSSGHNQTLSTQRAEAVQQYLTAAGVKVDGLSAKGYGDTRPMAPNSSELGRSQNRRVELVRQ